MVRPTDTNCIWTHHCFGWWQSQQTLTATELNDKRVIDVIWWQSQQTLTATELNSSARGTTSHWCDMMAKPTEKDCNWTHRLSQWQSRQMVTATELNDLLMASQQTVTANELNSLLMAKPVIRWQSQQRVTATKFNDLLMAKPTDGNCNCTQQFADGKPTGGDCNWSQ